MAHEIRNPLGSIKASAQYLSESTGQPEDRGEFLDIIVDEVDRLNRVVGSFLDYARPGHTNPEPIYVNSAVQLTLQFLRPECDSANVALHVTMDPDLPKVRIDIEHLRQVLINLMRNAIEAMQEDGGELTLPGRALMLVRNVGAHMYTDIVTLDGKPVPETFIDATITAPPMRSLWPPRNFVALCSTRSAPCSSGR